MTNIQKRRQIKNYRPITLLNIAHKIFAILLNKILSDIAEKKGKNVKSDLPQIALILIIYS